MARIALVPRLSSLTVYANSAQALPGEPIPDPVPVLDLYQGKILSRTRQRPSRQRPTAGPPVEAVLSERD